MPGDPKECRQHAVNCVQLAKTAESPEARDRFAHLARTWIRLAEEIESTSKPYSPKKKKTKNWKRPADKGADRSRRLNPNWPGVLSAIPPPPPHHTETKKSEANQAEGGGFGDGEVGYERLSMVGRTTGLPYLRVQ